MGAPLASWELADAASSTVGDRTATARPFDSAAAAPFAAAAHPFATAAMASIDEHTFEKPVDAMKLHSFPAPRGATAAFYEDDDHELIARITGHSAKIGDSLPPESDVLAAPPRGLFASASVDVPPKYSL